MDASVRPPIFTIWPCFNFDNSLMEVAPAFVKASRRRSVKCPSRLVPVQAKVVDRRVVSSMRGNEPVTNVGLKFRAMWKIQSGTGS